MIAERTVNLDALGHEAEWAVNPDALGHDDELELSIIMPCLNEVESLGSCIAKAARFLERTGVRGEIVVADNGSTDGSREVAQALGVRVVQVARRGYGAALAGGFAAARGRFLIMGDADDTYDFSDLMPFLHHLREGYDLVMGNRFRGGIQRRAMPLLHRYLGNPGLTMLARLLFRTPCGDVYCGLRGLSKAACETLKLQSPGMEYALEMVVKATLHKMRIAEVPTTLARSSRPRVPHLKTWRDGWRSLRLYLRFSPNGLFCYPGALMILAGLLTGGWMLTTPAVIGPVHVWVHALLSCAVAVLLGCQAVCFALFTKMIAVSGQCTPAPPVLDTLVHRVRVSYGVAAGMLLMLLGLLGVTSPFMLWPQPVLSHGDPLPLLRLVIPAVLVLALGGQAVFASLFFGLLKVEYLEAGVHVRTAHAA